MNLWISGDIFAQFLPISECVWVKGGGGMRPTKYIFRIAVYNIVFQNKFFAANPVGTIGMLFVMYSKTTN